MKHLSNISIQASIRYLRDPGRDLSLLSNVFSCMQLIVGEPGFAHSEVIKQWSLWSWHLSGEEKGSLRPDVVSLSLNLLSLFWILIEGEFVYCFKDFVILV